MKLNKLSREEEEVLVRKGTEKPFSGKYDKLFDRGVYLCRRCDAPLYLSDDKFDAHCGWPAFDQEIKGSVKRLPDSDGARAEIQCTRCGAHLGHVFGGERLTRRNVRHCVNSLSLKFVPETESGLASIVFGGGCFWCAEAIFARLKGVAKVTSGYAGGTVANPTYKQVCSGETGHAEVVKIDYDPSAAKLETLLELFFAMHDPTTKDRQGDDVGTQYRSILLYSSLEQKKAAGSFIKKVATEFEKPIITEVKKLKAFYPAEECHSQYYDRNANQPYCRLVITPKLQKLKEKFGLL